MNRNDAFKILGIEINADKRTIKKAYARLVKQYHPEEYPDKWKEVHEAYEVAIQLAEAQTQRESWQRAEGWESEVKREKAEDRESEVKRQRAESRESEVKRQRAESRESETKRERVESRECEEKRAPIESQKSEKNSLRDRTVNEERTDEKNTQIMFEHLSELTEEQKKQQEELRKKEIAKAIEEVKIIVAEKKINLETWKAFFYKQENIKSICSSEFLYEFGGLLEKIKFNEKLYLFLKEQLKIIAQYQSATRMEIRQVGTLKPVDYVKYKLEVAYGNRPQLNMSKKDLRAAAICIAIILFSIIIAVSNENGSVRKKGTAPVLQYEAVQNYTGEDDSEFNTNVKTYTKAVRREAKLKEFGALSDEVLEKRKEAAACLNENIYITGYDYGFVEQRYGYKDIFFIREMEVPTEIEQVIEGNTSEYRTYAFQISSYIEQKDKVLWCNLEGLGFSEECHIYYFDGGQYVEVVEWSD